MKPRKTLIQRRDIVTQTNKGFEWYDVIPAIERGVSHWSIRHWREVKIAHACEHRLYARISFGFLFFVCLLGCLFVCF